MRAKGTLEPGSFASTLTLTTVRCGVEACGCGKLMELGAVVPTANQSRRTPHLVVRVAVCDRVTDSVNGSGWDGDYITVNATASVNFAFEQSDPRTQK